MFPGWSASAGGGTAATGVGSMFPGWGAGTAGGTGAVGANALGITNGTNSAGFAANVGKNALATNGASKSMLSSASSFLNTAPGIGIAAGLVTGVLTGNWAQAAKTGLGTGIGFAVGGPLGAAAGGFISSMLGNSEPSNDPAVYSVNFNSGKVTDYTKGFNPSASLRKSVKGSAESLLQMAKTIEEIIPGAKFKGSMGLDIGTRDDPGIWQNNKLTHYSRDQYDKKLAETFMSKMTGVSNKVKEAVSRVDFSNPATAKQQLQYIKDNLM